MSVLHVLCWGPLLDPRGLSLTVQSVERATPHLLWSFYHRPVSICSFLLSLWSALWSNQSYAATDLICAICSVHQPAHCAFLACSIAKGSVCSFLLCQIQHCQPPKQFVCYPQGCHYIILCFIHLKGSIHFLVCFRCHCPVFHQQWSPVAVPEGTGF